MKGSEMACPKVNDDQLSEQLELARRILRLEQQLVAYQKLHAEELDEIYVTLTDCRKRLLTVLSV